MKWSQVVFALLVIVFTLPGAVSVNRNPGASQVESVGLVSNASSASALLTEADRLSWLGNWHAAGALYSVAETRFHSKHELTHEIHARLGGIRADAAREPPRRAWISCESS